MNVGNMGKEGGYDLIIGELDKVFLSDETSRAFCAFKEYYEYRRSSGDGFSEFIVEFEKRYTKVKVYKMELPEKVYRHFSFSRQQI